MTSFLVVSWFEIILNHSRSIPACRQAGVHRVHIETYVLAYVPNVTMWFNYPHLNGKISK